MIEQGLQIVDWNNEEIVFTSIIRAGTTAQAVLFKIEIVTGLILLVRAVHHFNHKRVR